MLGPLAPNLGLSNGLKPTWISRDAAVVVADDSFVIHRPAPAGFHIKFDGMTNVGGRAILYANNGWAVVTRLTPEVPGIERVTVKRTYVSGGTSDVAPLTYRCPVNGNGFFVCALVP
mgnify:CR=1 FL=1